MIWIMLFHQSPTQIVRTAAHLLCINMYISLLIGCAIILNIWCYIKAYLLYVSECSFSYLYLLQVIYRLCRIVFYTKTFLQSFNLYIGGIILQWIFSFLQVIPVYLLGIFQYLHNDFHCQIVLYNTYGLLIGLTLVHMFPITLTIICYIYTIIYIRQRVSDRRDLFVLKRVFILLTVMSISGIPPLDIRIFYQIFGCLPYWSAQFQWFTATFSVFCVSIILIFVLPNLQKF